jgi:hypothetical protein
MWQFMHFSTVPHYFPTTFSFLFKLFFLFLGGSRARIIYQLAKLVLESINVATEAVISRLVRYFRGVSAVRLPQTLERLLKMEGNDHVTTGGQTCFHS